MVKTCPSCGARYARLDRHLAGRGACAQAAARRLATAAPQEGQEGRRAPPAPPDLSEAGADLWAALMAEFKIEGHLLPIAAAACRELDRAARAEAEVAREGEYVSDRYGAPKQHPALAVARSSRLAAARLLRALQLPQVAA